VDLRGDVEPLLDLVAGTRLPGVTASVIGDGSIDADVEAAAERDLQRGEVIGLGLALVVLVLVFGTAAASLVPIVIAVTAIVVALGNRRARRAGLRAQLLRGEPARDDGDGGGDDYALFVVSRFREERRAGRAVPDAIAVAGGTAGHAVVFSDHGGARVDRHVLVPQTLFRSRATGAIVVVLVSVLVALTLLSLLGDRIELLPVVRRRARRRRPPRRGSRLATRAARGARDPPAAPGHRRPRALAIRAAELRHGAPGGRGRRRRVPPQ